MSSDRIHFGSLEGELKRQSSDEDDEVPPEKKSSVLPFSQATIEARERHARVIHALELKKRARAIAVPTNDQVVMKKLRELGEPIILFGERPENRRERLRQLWAKQGITLSSEKAERSSEKDELYYTEGSSELRAARVWLVKYSMPRAQARVEAQRRQREFEDELEMKALRKQEAEAAKVTSKFTGSQTEEREAMDVDEPEMEIPGLARKKELFTELLKFSNQASELGEPTARPLSACSISPDGKSLTTSSWSGGVQLWDITSCSRIRNSMAHTARATFVDWYPAQQPPASLNYVSSSADKTVLLWSIESDAPLGKLEGHEDVVNRIAFHPSGRLLASSSNDTTWRLWDLEKQLCLLQQDGHSRGVYAIGFHPDGSLIATAGLDAIGRVWDLRTGRSIFVMRGHVNRVLSLDFAPNGFQIASGGDDNTIKIWDLRKRKNIYTIPAHTNLVTHVKYQQDEGLFLMSSSFDKTCKIWSAEEYTPIHSLAGHEGRVTCCSISKDCCTIVTSSSDRTWKLWTKANETVL